MCVGRGHGERRWSQSRSFLSNNWLHLPLMYLCTRSFPVLSVGPSPVFPLGYLFLKLHKKKRKKKKAQPQKNHNKSGTFVSPGLDHWDHMFPALKPDYCTILTGWHSLCEMVLKGSRCWYRLTPGYICQCGNDSRRQLAPPLKSIW